MMVVPSGPNPPPRQREDPNENRNTYCVIPVPVRDWKSSTKDEVLHLHVQDSDGLHGREEEHDTDKADPSYGNDIDWLSPSAQRKRPLYESNSMLVNEMCQYDSNIG